jgi:hypothetical protein
MSRIFNVEAIIRFGKCNQKAWRKSFHPVSFFVMPPNGRNDAGPFLQIGKSLLSGIGRRIA